ncbi:MAG: cytochrome P450 [Desertimonas sp.]
MTGEPTTTTASPTTASTTTASTSYGPVTDWATDLDHADPSYNPNAPEIWAELRAAGCPVAHSDRYGGMWAPITHDLVREVAYDTEHFTSRAIVVSRTDRADLALAPIGGAPPISSDPPFHQLARRLLLPPFAPKQIEPWEPEIRALCRSRLDAMGTIVPGDTVIDAAVGYAQHIPVNVISRMLGLPPDDDDLMREFVHDVLEGVNQPPEARQAGFARLDAYLDAQIEAHRSGDRDDLIAYLMDVEMLGQKLSPAHVRGSIVLLMLAGIDTTWSAIGSSLWHLAAHPEDRKRLAEEPALIPTAVEEFLRAYAPVTMARLVAADHDFHGCPMKVDDWVLLPFPAANRDPEAFERADEVVIDRQENRHAAFGLGIHRCLGSNLARLEMRIAVEEFLARFPDFELADPAAVRWSVGQIRGPRVLPVVVNRVNP